MGVKNIEGYGTFRKMDKRSVTGFFKTAATRDPDVLLVKKQTLIAPNRSLKFVGIALTVFGAFLTITMILAFFGIPLMIVGGWIWWFAKRNIGVVEAAYSEYVGASALREG